MKQVFNLYKLIGNTKWKYVMADYGAADEGIVSYFMYLEVTGLRVNRNTDEKPYDQFLFNVIAEDDKIIEYSNVSDSTLSQLLWSMFEEKAGKNFINEYIEFMFSMMYREAEKRRMKGFFGKFLQADAKDCYV